MSDDARLAQRPRQRMFTRRYGQSRMCPERAQRQGHITHLAYALLGGREGALGFLNTYSDILRGRPLDLAMHSAAGYTAVEAAIQRLAQPHTGTKQ